MPEPAPLAALHSEQHIWLARTDNLAAAQLVKQYLPLLGTEERERYLRFHFDHDRYSYLAAHALVRITLSRYYPRCTPAQWRFTTNEYGKPEIDAEADCPPLRFNLSHTAGMVACVVALERDCGIDVETVRPLSDIHAMAEIVCSKQEVAYLHTLPEILLRQMFFTIWTLKEAYIKAIGLGFSAPLQQISFDLSQERIGITTPALSSDTQGNWLLHQHSPGSQHQLAVAVRQNHASESLVFHQLNLIDQQHQLLPYPDANRPVC